MNVDQLIAQYVPQPTDVELFDMFNVDMTESQVLVEVDGRLAMVNAMQRVSGQKTSERMLWSVGKVAPEKAAAIAQSERKAELDRLAAAYANDPAFEVECDTMALAIGLAKAYTHHTGEVPTFLLDDDGSL